jgi:sugar phosphate isomerase/epimerase
MTQQQVISVFTKPWREDSVDQLAERVDTLGFNGIELPVRPGYQVSPDEVRQLLPETVARLRAAGIEVHGVASDLEESVFAACSDAGVDMIRIQVPVSVEDGYFASRDAFRRKLDSLAPVCKRFGVRVGVQIHSGRYLARSTEVMEAIRDFEPDTVCAVWDAGHAALCGEDPEYGLATCGEHLALINLKNFRYERAENGGYERVSCSGETGFSSWESVLRAAAKANYRGAFCLSAQYQPEDDVNKLAEADCSYVKYLIGELSR